MNCPALKDLRMSTLKALAIAGVLEGTWDSIGITSKHQNKQKTKVSLKTTSPQCWSICYILLILNSF